MTQRGLYVIAVDTRIETAEKPKCGRSKRTMKDFKDMYVQRLSIPMEIVASIGQDYG